MTPVQRMRCKRASTQRTISAALLGRVRPVHRHGRIAGDPEPQRERIRASVARDADPWAGGERRRMRWRLERERCAVEGCGVVGELDAERLREARRAAGELGIRLRGGTPLARELETVDDLARA